mmetsp:Transcript_75950/g.212946  ORF Transcript_75950/g.212946 Transcript_75950/m.212946 type:complete len:219 (+) Transcript_75950:511-1167(+)
MRPVAKRLPAACVPERMRRQDLNTSGFTCSTSAISSSGMSYFFRMAILRFIASAPTTPPSVASGGGFGSSSTTLSVWSATLGKFGRRPEHATLTQYFVPAPVRVKLDALSTPAKMRPGLSALFPVASTDKVSHFAPMVTVPDFPFAPCSSSSSKVTRSSGLHVMMRSTGRLSFPKKSSWVTRSSSNNSRRTRWCATSVTGTTMVYSKVGDNVWAQVGD